jgi:hypothetical protein
MDDARVFFERGAEAVHQALDLDAMRDLHGALHLYREGIKLYMQGLKVEPAKRVRDAIIEKVWADPRCCQRRECGHTLPPGRDQVRLYLKRADAIKTIVAQRAAGAPASPRDVPAQSVTRCEQIIGSSTRHHLRPCFERCAT